MINEVVSYVISSNYNTLVLSWAGEGKYFAIHTSVSFFLTSQMQQNIFSFNHLEHEFIY